MLVLALILWPIVPAGETTIERQAMDTLTAVELDVGDTLRFELRNGRVVSLTVEETDARVVLTNLREPKKGFHGGGTVYEMSCRVRIDGRPLTLRRYVPVRQSFYEPLVVNGMRLWFDGVRNVERFLNDNHGGGVPRKDVRFAVQDATLPLCPQELRPWYPSGENRLDVAESYNANDVWMGPYHGSDLHGGLDINMPIGTPLWAPIDVDDQFYFNSLEAGHNNNRWRGIRTWPNGQRWVLQAHHIVRLLVPERTALRRGAHYAEAAGVLTGSHAHSHFVFKIGPKGDEVMLDPWILFWEIFENNKRRAGSLRASIAPVGPTRTGEAVRFRSEGSAPGVTGNRLTVRWSFGDGGTSVEPDPTYAYLRPGIYPVTLVVEDGVGLARAVHHITVDGDPADGPGLALDAPGEIAFRRRPAGIVDAYGAAVKRVPHTLEFFARPASRPRPAPKTVRLLNTRRGALAPPRVEVRTREGSGWLKVTPRGEELSVQVDARRLKNRRGIYRALVAVDCPGAANSPQVFGVRLHVPRPRDRPPSSVVVDNEDPGCDATHGFWLAPFFHVHFPERWKPGVAGGYLVNAGSAAKGEFVRFTPDLRAGTYAVSFPEETPFRPNAAVPAGARFAVRVRHRGGEDTVWVRPLESRAIGTFEFDEGRDGYVEILAGSSEGIVVADAVRFERR